MFYRNLDIHDCTRGMAAKDIDEIRMRNITKESAFDLLLDDQYTTDADVELPESMVNDFTLAAVAAYFNAKNSLQHILGDLKQVHERNRFNRTPLHFAAMMGNADCVQILLDRGADILLQDEKGLEAIRLAVDAGHANVVEKLVKQRKEMEYQPLVGEGNETRSRACSRSEGTSQKARSRYTGHEDLDEVYNFQQTSKETTQGSTGGEESNQPSTVGEERNLPSTGVEERNLPSTGVEESN